MDFFTFPFFIFLIFTFITLSRLIPANRNPKLPPGPTPLPIIGNLLALGDKPHESFTNLAKSYGPIMSLKLGQVTAIVFSTAETIQQVLQTHDNVLSYRFIPDAATVYDHAELGLPWIPITPNYKNHKKIFNNYLLSPKALDASRNLRRMRIDKLLDNIRRCAVNGEVVDVGRTLFSMALNLISYSIWSMDLVDTDSEMIKEFKTTLRGSLEEMGRPNISDFFPVLKKMDIQGVRRRTAVHFGKILGLIDEMIDKRLKMQESPDFTPKNDMLHHLLNMKEDNNQIPLDRNQIKHSIFVLFTAGPDAAGSIAQWAMAYLLKNPKVMCKAKEELMEVIGKGNSIEESHMEKLPYLQAIIKEALRMQSSLLIPRRAESEVTISGFTIPKGAQIIVNLWASCRDPNLWENPDMFIPERFLESKGRNFEFIPFSNGRRTCPGQGMGMRMLHLMVGSLIHYFNWKLEDGITPENLNMDAKFGISLAKAQPLRAIPLLV
ncbi:geraniol 8-hydroxylase-like [Cucumis melo var. makuwa]|uniref:Geraniol 8-hydroxylase-like n=1 Tax=Cucumis melo var. makuwa TaxID=1194695 RepID=A0A5A7THK3_CUCMM|nr:geraniol 8-hydroxylase-like [Cucumis melo var. makuwa]